MENDEIQLVVNGAWSWVYVTTSEKSMFYRRMSYVSKTKIPKNKTPTNTNV